MTTAATMAHFISWAPFYYTARVRLPTERGSVSTRRYILQDTVPIEPIEVSPAELRLVVRYRSTEFVDEVFEHGGRLYRRFRLPDAAYDDRQYIEQHWIGWMVSVVPGAPWTWARLENYPCSKAPTLDEIYVMDPRSRVVESDRTVRWGEAHARHVGSVLIVGDDVLVETKAPTWVTTADMLIYDAFRLIGCHPRRFDLAEIDQLTHFRTELGQRVPAPRQGRLELCELTPAGFEGRAVAIAIEALDFAAEIGRQTDAGRRKIRGVAEPYLQMQDLRRRESPPKASEVWDVVDMASRLHAALQYDYRSSRIFKSRAKRFIDTAVLRLRIENEAANDLSSDDLEALVGL